MVQIGGKRHEEVFRTRSSSHHVLWVRANGGNRISNVWSIERGNVMIIETWEHETDFGTDVATLTTHEKGDYFVNMGCVLWNRAYKRYPSAKKYLEKTDISTLAQR